jgi:hypothetical protein
VEREHETLRTSFNIFTFPINTPAWSSFWLSNSSSVAALYCPLELGVALRKVPLPLPLTPFAPGYAPKEGLSGAGEDEGNA